MKKLVFMLSLLTLSVSFAAANGTQDGASASKSGKPYAGKTLTVLYMSSVYADAARQIVPEFEALTGAKVDVVDFPYVTLHEKALLDLTSGTSSAYDVVDVASQWDGEFFPFLTDLGPFIKKDNYDMCLD